MPNKNDTKVAETPEKKNTYITLHKNFVRENIEYVDRKTSEMKTFNSVTLPNDTVIGDKDVSGYQFSPRFVNESKYRGENYRDIPLLTDREVWLQKSVMDAEGNRMTDENGRNVKGHREGDARPDQDRARGVIRALQGLQGRAREGRTGKGGEGSRRAIAL